VRIENRSTTTVLYEIKAGTPRMTMSTCELEPGEAESWRSRYRRHVGVADVEVHVREEEGGAARVILADDDATVIIEDSPAGWTLRLG
jgi:hypothetical protein